MCLGRVARRALEGDARLPLCGGGEFGLAAAPAKLDDEVRDVRETER